MPHDEPLSGPALDDQLCFAVYTMSLAFDRFYRPLLSKLGLTYPQYLVLQVLWANDGQSVKAIGERLQLDSGTLTPLLKRLEGSGLLTRQRNSSDERRLIVSLTPAGGALRAQTIDLPEQVVCSSGSNAAELQVLAARLIAFRNALEGRRSPLGMANPDPL